MIQTINGSDFRRMVISAAASVEINKQKLNDLNVFPVPDGDTGTNMVKTLEGGLTEIDGKETDGVGVLAKCFARGALLGARGNSGVILSQIFSGIGEELAKHEIVDARILAEAYLQGIKKSYSAVQNPTEGTILTVFRVASQYASENINDGSSVEEFFKLHLEKAEETLQKTKEMLPVLAEADVVDSGAAGYLYLAMGMYQVLTGKTFDSFKIKESAAPKIDLDSFTRDSVLEFGYCTEFMLRLTSNKVDPDSFEIDTILAVLNELNGQSIVAYKEGDIVKVHVHTFNPGIVLTRAQEFGEFLTVKIENMSVSHTENEKPKKKATKPYSVLTVATGDGLCALFKDLGADEIVAGGQSSNPSTEEFIEAFNKCEGAHIIVLPNNKNVFLAAKQAAELYDSERVHIIPTKNLMQGYGALSVISPGITDVDMLINSINRSIEGIVDGEITCAVRDVTLGGKNIKKGDYIAVSGGEIVALGKDAEDAVMNMLESTITDEQEIITLFVGKDVELEACEELALKISEAYPDFEVEYYIGGQEVYNYMLAIE